MPRSTAWLSKVNPKLPSLSIQIPLSLFAFISHDFSFRDFTTLMASDASSIPPGNLSNSEKKSHADFPQIRRPLFVLISCQHTHGVLHGSDSSAGVRVPWEQCGQQSPLLRG